MAYDYVRRMYGVEPVVGARVRHTELKGPKAFGTIAREHPSRGHYVMVKFDGQTFASPCHPKALDYAPPVPEAAPCINHPDRPAITNLDGDDLCLDCANDWVRAEGDWQRYIDDEAGHGE